MTRRIVMLVVLVAAWPAGGRGADDLPMAGCVVVVDPGHGGQAYSKSYTGGTRGVASKLTEGDLNLRVGLELAAALKRLGATVHLTRVADHRLSREGSKNDDELHARIDHFEHHNCHFFVSVHHNAGPATAAGHTALYKHNAADDTLYEAAARHVNDALEGAVPGPKLKLIKGSYHILRETPIPGTIAESGFQTSRAFDDLSARVEYPKAEAAALAKGAGAYWAAHKPALVALRTQLAKARADKPRDATTYTAVALNPAAQKRAAELLAKVAPAGRYEAAKADDYVQAFRKAAVKPGATFTVVARSSADGVMTLTGEVADRGDHDRLIDLLVSMKLHRLVNEVQFPKPAK